MRLIPAGAGQIHLTYPPESHDKAHPRRCGADGPKYFGSDTETGSSPQVRGRFAVVNDSMPWEGLIPAGAGQMLFEQPVCSA